MKNIIVVYGNMGSGKSTFCRLLKNRLSGYEYICLDDFRKKMKDQYLEVDNFQFEKNVAEATAAALVNASQILYESTGSTKFFREKYSAFLREGEKVFTVKIACSKSVCLDRHLQRKASGKAHIIPHFKNEKTEAEMIDWFEAKSNWIKPDLVLDSELYSPEQLVSIFLKKYFGEPAKDELNSILKKFDYKTALTWFTTHVEGNFFLKEMLTAKEDEFNRIKLKKELQSILDKAESLPEPTLVKPKVEKPIIPKKDTADPKNTITQLKEESRELEDRLEELQSDLEDEINQLKEKLAEKSEPKQMVESASDSKEDLMLDVTWKPLYKEAYHLFTLIDESKSEDDNRELAFRVLDTMDEVERLWAEKDFLKKHGQLPNFDHTGADQLTVEQIATRIRTLRTYISKAKKGILKADRIPDWESEMADLERRLKE